MKCEWVVGFFWEISEREIEREIDEKPNHRVNCAIGLEWQVLLARCRISNNDCEYDDWSPIYLAPAYSGHHEQMQQNNSVRMDSAISSASAISSQNRNRFSAR